MIEANGLDAIASTTNGPSWCIDHINGDYYTGFSFSTPAAISGFPHITVPMGTVFGLPVGFSLMGRPGRSRSSGHGLRFRAGIGATPHTRIQGEIRHLRPAASPKWGRKPFPAVFAARRGFPEAVSRRGSGLHEP